MKVIHKKPLPKIFSTCNKGIACEGIFKLTPNARLCAKLLVFHTRRDMRRFADKYLNGGIGRYCAGVVSKLTEEVYYIPKEGPEVLKCIHVDPRYFAVVCLCKHDLTMEIITHEAIHAGFAYDYRKRLANKWHDPDNHEEGVCYPAGMIASAINKWLRDNDMYRFTKFKD